METIPNKHIATCQTFGNKRSVKFTIHIGTCKECVKEDKTKDLKIRKLTDYVEAGEEYYMANTMRYICDAYVDDIDVLKVTKDQLRGIAVTFDVKTDWDMTVWGMKIEIYKLPEGK